MFSIMTQNLHRGVSKPLRILHIAFTMHARGTETWLMNVLRKIDKKRFKLDFLTIDDETGVYDQEIKDLGGNLYSCPNPVNKIAFLRGFRKVLEEKGPFDIVHAHPYTLSGLILMQAARAGVPVRIVHSHTDRRKAMRDKSLFRIGYIYMMKKLISYAATYGLAASKDAAISLFGKKWINDNRFNVMYCGIDLDNFKKLKSKKIIRKELGIPNNSYVLGHVGSFNFEKNHDFLIRIFAKIARSNLNLHLLLVGDGPLKEKIQDKIKTLNLNERVTFTGVRQDVPDLLSAMDLFVFPSLFEGLGLSVVEAQAAGLPCLLSDNVPQEVLIVDGSVSFIPIENSEDQWITAIKSSIGSSDIDKDRALSQVISSPFNIERNVKMIEELYENLSIDHGKNHE